MWEIDKRADPRKEQVIQRSLLFRIRFNVRCQIWLATEFGVIYPEKCRIGSPASGTFKSTVNEFCYV